MAVMVRFDGVGLSYGPAGQGTRAAAGPEVLHDLSFALPDGAFRWLLGPSGAGKTSLLLADEPTGNLDEVQAERLMQLLKEMNRLGTTVVVATHNDALVGRHAAHALRLSHGRLVGER